MCIEESFDTTFNIGNWCRIGGTESSNYFAYQRINILGKLLQMILTCVRRREYSDVWALSRCWTLILLLIRKGRTPLLPYGITYNILYY